MNTAQNMPAFESLWRDWQDCLGDGEDAHSICNQVLSLMWDACAFLTINEARRWTSPSGAREVSLNAAMHNLLDRCFVYSQAAAIRRICDGSYGMRGPRGVRSLNALLKDLLQNVNLLTRERICIANRLPVDLGPLVEAEKRQTLERLGRGDSTWSGGGILVQAEAMHLVIDGFVGVDSDDRSPDDQVEEEILQSMINRLETESEQVTTWATKFSAHAATPESRRLVTLASPTLERFWRAEEAICRIYSLLEFMLNGSSSSCIAFADFDVARHADKPLVETGKLSDFRKHWEKVSESMSAWNDHDLTWLSR